MKEIQLNYNAMAASRSASQSMFNIKKSNQSRIIYQKRRRCFKKSRECQTKSWESIENFVAIAHIC